MTKNLLIVESPAKAKTIEKYLGKDFKVKSSYGHIRDLEKGKDGIDIDNGFIPKYVVTPDKKKVVKDLKNWVKKSTEVWLATDEDREGEAISWHLCKVLGLDDSTTKRIVFREITKPAIQKAIENPRTVDKALVNAQQARRILDRLVGYGLSEVLWRKVRSKLSAGRVQSVAVKLIVEREREIQDFDPEPYFRVTTQMNATSGQNKRSFKAELPERLSSLEDANKFVNDCAKAEYTVDSVEKKPVQRKPSAPFITSTLQQEASRKLGFSVKRTMSVAQKLYEKGHITYMRTDSTNLSELALKAISTEVEKRYGKEYARERRYNKKKAAGAQEAHEAIRPTYVENEAVVSGDPSEERLYELIWKRTVASQMANARLERTKAKIAISTRPDDRLEATGEVLKFEGFLKVYIESTDDEAPEEQSGILPPLSVGQVLDLLSMDATERFTRPPSRFTEAMLVKKLEELGIGRPSTYAPTISRIMEPSRGYITKESREGVERRYRRIHLESGNVTVHEETEITGATSNRLYPSDIGMVVTDFLEEHFPEIMNYEFTAGIEHDFDTIAEGDLDWDKMISGFHGEFNEELQNVMDNAARARGKRILGTDEGTGHTILAQMTRYGPVVQIGTREEVGEDGKPKFANLRPGQSLETITLEEAMDLFKLPRELGEYKDRAVTVGTGRYGPYVKWNEQFISIPKGEDPLEISGERALELIKAKERENMPIAEYEGKPVTKGKGRYGPYLKWDGLFVNVPKKYDFDNLSSEEVRELISRKVEKEKNRYIRRWEKEGLALENGRWGPFIRKGRKSISIPKVDGKKITSEEAAQLSLDDVKKIVEGEVPEALKSILSKQVNS